MDIKEANKSTLQLLKYLENSLPFAHDKLNVSIQIKAETDVRTAIEINLENRLHISELEDLIRNSQKSLKYKHSI